MNQNTRIRSKPVPEHCDAILSGEIITPAPAGTVRADVEVQTQAGCE